MHRPVQAARDAMQQARELLDEGGLDPELRDMAQEEYSEQKQLLETLEEELKTLLLPKDENDDRSVIVEIRGGAGGDEAALFAASLLRMYTMYAQQHGFAVEVLNANETELGGMKEVSFSVEGAGAYSRFKFESGVHRVQRVPETETQGRIHTSTVTVAVMPEAEESKWTLRRPICASTRSAPRRGRPAHQQDVVRHPRDAHPHGNGGGMSGRAQSV